MAGISRWVKPETYPLAAAMGAAIGLCGFMLLRSALANPDVRINKVDRAAGVLENFEEGKKFKEHAVRRWLKEHPPMIMPGLNRLMSDPPKP